MVFNVMRPLLCRQHSLTILHRFFIFHASLVIALAILGNVGSPDLPKWQDDLEHVQHVLRNVFRANPLAARCAAVLDLIVHPAAPAMDDNLWTQHGLDSSLIDFSMWPSDGGDPLSFFGWSDPGRLP
jgi:transcriptional regulatory protein GAL4